MKQIYLSRRNLLTLLSKLDRAKEGEVTACTLIKRDDEHPMYPSSPTIVTAVEDDKYYTNRKPGIVHHKDEPK